MSYTFNKKTGEIVFGGWEKGIAASPHQGLSDLRNVNISSIRGEISVAYNRVRVDQVALTSQTATMTNGFITFGYTTILQVGTWIHVTGVTGGGSAIANGGYYIVLNAGIPGVTIELASTFGGSAITADATGSFTFDTVAMGTPIDYCSEYHAQSSTTGATYRYFVLDTNGIIWVSGTASAPGNAAKPSTTMTWMAINPANAVGGGTVLNGSIAIMYATDSSNVVKKNWLMIFTDSQILEGRNDDNSGWPSVSSSAFSLFQVLNYQTAPHKAQLGNDQVLYFTDGPGIGIIQQKTGQQFDPTNVATYNYVNANYLMAPEDVATRVTTIPSGSGLSIVVGGILNNIYVYPSYQGSTNPGPTSLLWMPEANTEYLLQVNNFVLIFAGNKGNIYLTNGSSVVPLLTVPDYIAGSVNFVQDPYFIWGGAAYLRGRVFFSLKDQTASHTGNCGGVWSFVPSFNYFPEQDTGLSLRMEAASSQHATHGYNGYAPVIFTGQESTAQQANGPQYIACWAQTTDSTTTDSIDFSGTNPLTNSTSLIETDAVPVGTFLEKKTFRQIEVKFAAALVAGESISINYRTSLESAWTSAGTIIYESDMLAAITNSVTFEKAQIIQLQVILNGTTSSPSWVRVREIYLR